MIPGNAPHLTHHAATLALLLALLAGCRGNETTIILPDDISIEAGDVVLRRGCGLTSRFVIMADEGGSYSHVGIAVCDSGRIMIVHAVPDEPDYDGDVDRVKMDTPGKYFSSTRAEAGCVLRHGNREVAERAAGEAEAMFRRRILFDHDYDSGDTAKLYCCELVENAYAKAGQPLVGKGQHNVNLPGMRLRNVVFPSDFLRSSALRTVARFGKLNN